MTYYIEPDYKLLRATRYYTGAVRDMPHAVIKVLRTLKKMTADTYEDIKAKIESMDVPKSMIPVIQSLSVERNLVFANKILGRSLIGIIFEKE